MGGCEREELGLSTCSHLTVSSNCAFVMLKCSGFFVDIFDPELIKSIVAELLDINEISKTSCVQVARMSG